MPDKKIINIHLVSDSTGESVQRIAEAVISQFPGVLPKFFVWPIINKLTRVATVVRAVKEHPGIVLYTIADTKLSSKLVEAIQLIDNTVSVPGLDYITMRFAKFLNITPHNIAMLQYQLDEDYFKKIEILNFTHEHDDGRMTKDISKADILLLGISRTSKTPTSAYLSHRGFKVANIPITNIVDINNWIEKNIAPGPIVIGLTIDPNRLCEIRKMRVKEQSSCYDNKYIDYTAIKAEINDAKKLFGILRCPVIDVTNRSIEETAAHIIRIYHTKTVKLQ